MQRQDGAVVAVAEAACCVPLTGWLLWRFDESPVRTRAMAEGSGWSGV